MSGRSTVGAENRGMVGSLPRPARVAGLFAARIDRIRRVSEKKKDRGGCSIVTIICFGIALLLVLYVLSAGPVGTLLNHNLI